MKNLKKLHESRAVLALPLAAALAVGALAARNDIHLGGDPGHAPGREKSAPALRSADIKRTAQGIADMSLWKSLNSPEDFHDIATIKRDPDVKGGFSVHFKSTPYLSPSERGSGVESITEKSWIYVKKREGELDPQTVYKVEAVEATVDANYPKGYVPEDDQSVVMYRTPMGHWDVEAATHITEKFLGDHLTNEEKIDALEMAQTITTQASLPIVR